MSPDAAGVNPQRVGVRLDPAFKAAPAAARRVVGSGATLMRPHQREDRVCATWTRERHVVAEGIARHVTSALVDASQVRHPNVLSPACSDGALWRACMMARPLFNSVHRFGTAKLRKEREV